MGRAKKHIIVNSSTVNLTLWKLLKMQVFHHIYRLVLWLGEKAISEKKKRIAFKVILSNQNFVQFSTSGDFDGGVG